MLQSLTIKNYALLRDVTVHFEPGLNILTGETGAGKSILVGALGMILGGRTPPETVGKYGDRTVVEGEFYPGNSDRFLSVAAKLKFNLEGPLLVRREIRRNGQGRCFINDSPVTLTVLREIGVVLVDLHGQHEHQSLLSPASHLEYLDGSGDYQGLRRRVRELFYQVQTKKSDLNKLEEKGRLAQEKRELQEFQLQEIKGVNPQPDEEGELERERILLENSERLSDLTHELVDGLYEGEDALYDRLVRMERLFEELKNIDGQFGDPWNEIQNVKISLQEVARFVQNYRERIEFDPQRLEDVRERLGAFARLKKKYGGSIDGVLRHRDYLRDQLALVENLDDELSKLQAELEDLCQELSEKGGELSGKREQAAAQFERALIQNLGELGIKRGKFKVSITHTESPDGLVSWDGERVQAKETGIDAVEFLISTNVGEEPKPLARVASGGEISRIMLAFKSILAGKDAIDTLIFDEIDIGISGRIAHIVGQKLKALAQHHQIICITHLPQIASLADRHFAVEKRVVKGRSETQVKELTFEDRVLEVAKLIGGERVTPTNLQSAREMLEDRG
ncbi:DNA repair protein RecN [candidate division KSB1 bacterium]|nr:DNA repair protein RecN [candidate division KSB1 bacterium]